MRYFDDIEEEKKNRRLAEHPVWIQNLFKNIPTVHDVYDDILVPYVKKENILLDAGCGKKGIMNKYKGKLKYAVGIDLSLSSLKQNNALDGCVLGELNKLPFPDGVFDIIISQWAAEHLPEPRHSFMEFYRVLKKGGGLILVTNSIYHPLMFFSSIFPERFRDNLKHKLLPREIEEDTFPTYYRCNTLKEIEKVLKGIGFSKVYDTYIGDPSFFIFSKILFPCLLFYEEITNIPWLKKFKMHIVAHYTR